MATKTSVLEVIETIEKAAKRPRIGRREPSEKKLTIGKGVRQGDIYLTRVPADWPRGEVRKHRQIADGTSIGQRHCIAKSSDVVIYEVSPDAEERMISAGYARRVPLGMACGPVVVAKARLLNTHPEHDHYSLPAGVYQVTYQMDDQSKRKVED